MDGYRNSAAREPGLLVNNEDDQGTEIHPELALLLTTSGSTGSPKLVRLTLKNLSANAESIAQYLHLTPQERPITSLANVVLVRPVSHKQPFAGWRDHRSSPKTAYCNGNSGRRSSRTDAHRLPVFRTPTRCCCKPGC